MAASVVDICNQALYLLGQSAITALDEGTRPATICTLLWPEVRDMVLSDHPWNCAIHRDELAQSTTDPEYEYSYQYALPTDPYCLRVLSTSNDDYVDSNGDPAYPWKVEGRYLLTDADTVKIRYIKRVTDVTQYPPFLVTAMAAKLASELAFPITRNLNIHSQMEQLYQRKLADAKAVDAQEGTPDKFESDVLWNFRF